MTIEHDRHSSTARAPLHPRAGRLLLVGCIAVALSAGMEAQGPEAERRRTPAAAVEEELTGSPVNVEVNPVARDEEIGGRLLRVLEATGWFADPRVRVDEGVVFLEGRVQSEELKNWAGDLARRTQGVVAVVNRMQRSEPAIWDWDPARRGLVALWRDFVQSLPLLFFGLLILALSLGAGVLSARGAGALLRNRVRARLLRKVIALAAGAAVVLVGTYIVLRVAGLTQLALTLLGGTGLIGLAVGIAFRDITENFLASIFLSVQRPFEPADLVEVAGVTGYVQQLNMRTTILMALDGNLVQIPNASVYKNNIRNFTTNANRREDFVVGIGYEDSIDQAQEVALEVLADHPAVLRDPEPLVLADSLGKATVNVRIYFWINGREHSWLKVRSSVIRLVKRAFQNEGISMPDEAREVVFPQGVPVTRLGEAPEAGPARPGERQRLPGGRKPEEPADVSTKAEAGFSSEAGMFEEQARQAQTLRKGEDLLQGDSSRLTAD